MIKAKVGNTIILGLSDINIEKLKNNEPILFNLKEAGIEDIDVNVMIFNGRTEESMMESMMKDMSLDTKIRTNDDVNFKVGKYMFNQNKRTLTLNSIEKKLTNKEAHLLKMLCTNPDGLDRNVALKEIWRDVNYYNGRSMDVYIAKLRSFLKQDTSIEILNIHGRGFKLRIKTD